MPTKTYKPTSPGRRTLVSIVNPDLSKDRPEKKLVRSLSKSGGRNNYGRITARHIGGGHKRKYRVIDFKRDKDGIPAKVATIEYDPNRSARIALVHYVDGEKRYILHARGLSVGDEVLSGSGIDPTLGNSLPLGEMPLGTLVHAVELVPGKGAQMARSAGVLVQLVAKEGGMVTLRLPSTEMRMVRRDCRATVGQVGNHDHELIRSGKAGRTRWKGRRPKVRGVAMNPVDHPLGGGEGRSSGGRPPVSPWGKPEGRKTRKRHKKSNRLIVRGRKRGKATQ